MISILWILIQLTLLLGIALLASSSIKRTSAPRAHRVVLSGLVCIFALPILGQVANELGWGLLPPRPNALQQRTELANELQFPSETQAPSPRVDAIPKKAWKGDSNTEFEIHTDSRADVEQNPSQQFTDIGLLNSQDAPANIPTWNEKKPSPLAEEKVALRPVFQSPTGPEIEAPLERATHSKFNIANLPTTNILIGLWAFGSALMTYRLVRGVFHAKRIVCSSLPIKNENIELALASAATDLKISESIQLRESDDLTCPVIWSWGAPVIILPGHSVDEPLDWRSILTHELAHLKRKDHWSTLIAELSKCLLPWHPLVLLSCRRLFNLSEIACDAWAIRFSKSPETYAESLLAFAPVSNKSVQQSLPHFGFSAMATHNSHLQKRVSNVLSSRTQNPNAGFYFNVAIWSLAAVLAISVALLRSHSPTNSVELSNSNTAIQTSVTNEEPTSIKLNEDDKDETDNEADENKAWAERLTNIPSSARWFVGKNMGTALSQMPGDRGYRILNSCWSEIAASVRQQILKGYSFEQVPNQAFFKVMNLGMNSKDRGVREFASSYLKMAMMKDFSEDSEAYRAWYATTKDLTAEQVIEREIKNLVASARDPKTRNVRGFLAMLTGREFQMKTSMSPSRKRALLNSGLEQLLNEWVEAGFVEKNDPVFSSLAKLKETKKQTNPTASVSLESTDEQWIAHLRSIPSEARWHVGANLGAAMTRMAPSRVKKILNACWSEIDSDARAQILKGFNPGFGQSNDAFLDVIDLGMNSDNERVRSFAKTYLSELALRKFPSQVAYQQWRDANKDKTPSAVFADSLSRIVDALDSLDEVELIAKLNELQDYRVFDRPFPTEIANSGLKEKIREMFANGKLTLSSYESVSILKKANLSPKVMRAGLDRELKRMVEFWESYIASGEKDQASFEQVKKAAQYLGQTDYPYVIPTMIGLIQADNSSETVYWVGYFGLKDVARDVDYSATHDGDWWGRWWEKNKDSFPTAVQEREIPVLSKSKHGKNYTPYPENMDTTEGVLAWITDQVKSEKDVSPGVELIEQELKDPTAIPTLIGVLEADHNDRTKQSINQALQALTGKRYHPIYSDGAWWRRWWEKNKVNFSAEIQNVSIPNFPKTRIGQSYQSNSHLLETIDGRVQLMRDNPGDEEVFDQIRDCVTFDEMLELGKPEDIPKLIGLLDCDNSRRSISNFGELLEKLTAVKSSRFHDGNWWRIWWEKNKVTFPENVRSIPIPDLPKTPRGKKHKNFPIAMETIDDRIAFANTLHPSDSRTFDTIVDSLTLYNSPTLPEVDNPGDANIPKIIGLLDADNSQSTVQTLGSGILKDLTGVKRLEHHDGAWWRRWWSKNKTNFSEVAQSTPIPNIKKTAYGLKYQPFPESLDSVEGMIQWVKKGCPSHRTIAEYYVGQSLAATQDPRTIPVIIGWMSAAGTTEALSFAEDEFEAMTGVKVVRSQTPQWWSQWWSRNKDRFGLSNADAKIPDLSSVVSKYKAALKKSNDAFNVRHLSSVKKQVGGDEKKTYFQIGPYDSHNYNQPKDGWKLLVILPGGDGSEDFNPFCRQIGLNLVDQHYVVVQLVAPKWSTKDDYVAWPTRQLNPDKATFTTEDLIKDVVADVKKSLKVDDKHVFALGWSSGGPPVYTNSLAEDSPVTGSFVAMSVFHPQNMKGMKTKVKDHPYFILHSPHDWIKMDQHATVAVKRLKEFGAKTKLQMYSGGHGWTDDPFGYIKKGTRWLEQNTTAQN